MLFQFPAPAYAKDGDNRWISIKQAIDHFPDPDLENNVLNHIYSAYKVVYRNFTGHRETNPDKPSPTILARGNGKGGVCAIPHYNGNRRLTIRESASVQTFRRILFCWKYEFVLQADWQCGACQVCKEAWRRTDQIRKGNGRMRVVSLFSGAGDWIWDLKWQAMKSCGRTTCMKMPWKHTGII